MSNELISNRLNLASSLSTVADIILMLLLIGNDFYFGIELNDSLQSISAIVIIAIPVISLALGRTAKKMYPGSNWATVNTILSIMFIGISLILCFFCLSYYGIQHIPDFFDIN